MLLLIGVAEAVVHQNRYRSTNGSAWAAGVWTLLLALLRFAWVALGVSAVLKEQWLAAFAYAVPAAVVTGLVRAREIRREARRVSGTDCVTVTNRSGSTIPAGSRVRFDPKYRVRAPMAPDEWVDVDRPLVNPFKRPPVMRPVLSRLQAKKAKPGPDGAEIYHCHGCDGEVPMVDAIWLPPDANAAVVLDRDEPFCCAECWLRFRRERADGGKT